MAETLTPTGSLSQGGLGVGVGGVSQLQDPGSSDTISIITFFSIFNISFIFLNPPIFLFSELALARVV